MKSNHNFADEMLEHARNKYLAVHAQREEIMEAFVAKYGFQPDECQQIVQGGKWFVIRLDPEMVRTIRRNLIQRIFWNNAPTRWQRFCLRMARLK